ncbi:hypothetical protein [Thermococcus sp.]|uniref:hypothetical protein n=1 Tax=Thermococcus sp. TaxID=35749 RepID=UPI0026280D9F|nr:hypothetical protein [Thermococcus sp.]
MVRAIIPDQKTIRDSERRARVKTKEFLREKGEAREYSVLETIIGLILILIVIGFVLFVLRNYL